MKIFNKEQNGYSINEVDGYLNLIQKENDEQIKKLNQKIVELKQENIDLQQMLAKQKSLDAKITRELEYAEEKAQKIIDSAKTVYELEIRRMQLLYRKWDDVLHKLNTELVKYVPEGQVEDVTGDFNKALSMTLETSFSMQSEEGKLYAKSVLTRMGGGKKIHKSSEIIKKNSPNKKLVITTETTTVTQESSAERFLNGEGVDIPASMGKLGKDVFHIPPANAFEKEKEKGFSLEEALVPTESLEEIMKSFSIEE